MKKTLESGEVGCVVPFTTSWRLVRFVGSWSKLESAPTSLWIAS